MNQNRFYLKRTLGLLAFVICGLTAFSQSFEVDGILYEIKSPTELTVSVIKNANKYSGRINIPSEVIYDNKTYRVISIGISAFSSCSDITSISIPSSIISIGENAFNGCSGLTSVTIPEGATTIGNSAFRDCSCLLSVVIPNSVTNIGTFAFYNCSSLISVTIPNGLTVIKDRTFAGCSNLESIAIPKTIQVIERLAFYECYSLKRVFIDDIAAWCNISFYSQMNIQNIVYDYSNPLYQAGHLFLHGEEIIDLVIPNEVTSIKDYAFFCGRGIKTVTIPSSVNSIGSHAFAYSGLTSVVLPNSVTTIGSNAFHHCVELTSVALPNSVSTIGSNAFQDCFALTSIIIPNSVTNIGEEAFMDCSNLTTVILPENLKIIKSKLFFRCSKLGSLIIPSEVEYIYQSAFAWSGLEEVKVLAETPPFAFDNTFSNYQIPLYVPATSIERYQTNSPWNKFSSFKTIDGEDVQVKKCEKPTISYNNGEISFSCETEDVDFVSSISDSDVKNYTVAKIPLNVTYTVSVRAIKAGFQDSDVTTATLCWIDAEPKAEGINSVTQVRSYSVMIQNNGGSLTIQGVNNGMPIRVYEANGKLAGTGISQNGKATVNTNLQTGAIAIVKIGERSVKVVIK